MNKRLIKQLIENNYLVLIIFIFIIGYIIPTAYNMTPYGSDVFSHLFYTEKMSKTESLSEFYDIGEKEQLTGSKYPFGFWLFSSIVVKIVDIPYLSLALVQPVFLFFIIICLYYILSLKLENSRKIALFSVLLFLTIPLNSIGTLNHETDVFCLPLILAVIILLLDKDVRLLNRKSTIKFAIIVFALSIIPFTHAGTTLFLITFLTVYAITGALLNKAEQKSVLLTLFIFISLMILEISIFSEIQNQYIDKGRLFTNTGEMISSILGIQIFYTISEEMYQNFFVKPNIVYAFAYTSVILIMSYAARYISILLWEKISDIKHILPAAVPLGSSARISHTYIYWPVWLGPVHSLTSILGLKYIKRETLILLIAVLLVTIPSGLKTGERALRELGYISWLILPLVSSIGFFKLIEKLRHRLPKILVFSLLTIYFCSLVLIPVMGNYYFAPSISGTKSERLGLLWLGYIGEPSEGVAAPGYGHRISLYSDKIPPEVTWVPYGDQLRGFGQNYRNANLELSESSAKDLYASYGVTYLIVSDRTLKNTGIGPENTKIDESMKYDNIYSSVSFETYRYVESLTKKSELRSHILYNNSPEVVDSGSDFLVESNSYKVKINKEKPLMNYVGTRSVNLIGDGDIFDFVTFLREDTISLQHINYDEITYGNNSIQYKTVLKKGNSNSNIELGSVIINFDFYDTAVKKQITITNDRGDEDKDHTIYFLTRYLTPMDEFILYNEELKTVHRKVYPNEDYSTLDDLEFNKIYLTDGTQGLLTVFEPTYQYPNEILYKGLTNYDYLMIDSKIIEGIGYFKLTPGDSITITQWISSGSFEEADKNIEEARKVFIYNYPEGIVPIIPIMDFGTINSPEDIDGGASEIIELLKKERIQYVVEVGDKSNVSAVRDLIKLTGKSCIVDTSNISSVDTDLLDLCDGLKMERVSFKDIPLIEKNTNVLFSTPIMPPVADLLYDEGFRRLKNVVYMGNETDIVLFPMSMPFFNRIDIDLNSTFRDMEIVIDSSVKNKDVVVLEFDVDKMDYSNYADKVIKVIQYGLDRDMEFRLPIELANYYNSVKRVYVDIEKGDEINMSITNNNDKTIKGFTIGVKGKCPELEGVTKEKSETCYVSLDLPPGKNDSPLIMYYTK